MTQTNMLTFCFLALIVILLVVTIYILPNFLRKKHLKQLATELGLHYRKNSSYFKRVINSSLGYKLNIIDGVLNGHNVEIYDNYERRQPLFLAGGGYFVRRTKIRIDNDTKTLQRSFSIRGFSSVSKIKKYLTDNTKIVSF